MILTLLYKENLPKFSYKYYLSQYLLNILPRLAISFALNFNPILANNLLFLF